MIRDAGLIKKSLENDRELPRNVETGKARQIGKHPRHLNGNDVSMYDDGMKQLYRMGEVKKRRGVSQSPLFILQCGECVTNTPITPACGPSWTLP